MKETTIGNIYLQLSQTRCLFDIALSSLDNSSHSFPRIFFLFSDWKENLIQSIRRRNHKEPIFMPMFVSFRSSTCARWTSIKHTFFPALHSLPLIRHSMDWTSNGPGGVIEETNAHIPPHIPSESNKGAILLGTEIKIQIENLISFKRKWEFLSRKKKEIFF